MAVDPEQMETTPDTEGADEQMLESVQQAMGGGGPGGAQGGAADTGGPPPGSGMEWKDVGQDQQALASDPSPLNVASFVQYWGIENMPPELMQPSGGGGDMGDAGGGMY